MKKLLTSVSLLALLTTSVVAQQTKTQLNNEINTQLPDNVTGVITPAILRGVLHDMVNSSATLADQNTVTGGEFRAPTLTASQGIISLVPFSGQATIQIGSPNVATAPYIDFWSGGSASSARLIASGTPSVTGGNGGVLHVGSTLTIETQPFTDQKMLTGFAQGPTGTVAATGLPSTCALGAVILNFSYLCASEGADTTPAYPGSQTWAHVLALDTGGTNSTGTKIALVANLYKSTASNPSTGRDQIAFSANAFGVASEGGTGLTPGVTAKGTLFASSFGVRIDSNAQNYLEIAGTEVDIGINAPATAAYRFGWEVVSQGDTHGAVQDGAYVIGSTSSIGFKTGYLLTFANGSPPIANTGCVICSDGTAHTVATFADFSTWTFTGNIFNFGVNFKVTGVGALTVAGFVQAGVVAVASLPTCNAGTEGSRMGVNNSNAASFTAGIGAVVAGGGTTHVPVYCDGTNWRIG